MIRLCAFSDEASDSLEGQIAALLRNNIKLTELRSVGGVNVKDFTNEQAEAYAKQLAESGIRVWAIGSPLGKTDISKDFAEYEKTVRRVCEIANIFGCDKIRVFSFYNAYCQSEKVFENLRRMVKIAGEYGITLYHENEKGVYGDVVGRVENIAANVSGLKFVFDPANYVQEGEDVTAALKKVGKRTAYFHIKDAIKGSGEIVPAGEGNGEIEKLISLVTAGDKVFTLEPHLSLFTAYTVIDDTELKNRYHFATNDESFDFAVNALKNLLKKQGYKETADGFVKE